jgi:germination protein M
MVFIFVILVQKYFGNEVFMARARKQKKNRTGMVFMLTIIVLLGIVVFAYRDKFIVFLNTMFNSGKEFVDKKVINDKYKKDEKSILEKINNIDKKNEKQSEVKKEVVPEKNDSNSNEITKEEPKKNNEEPKKIEEKENVEKIEKKDDIKQKINISEIKDTQKKEQKQVEKKPVAKIKNEKKAKKAKISKKENVKTEEFPNSRISKIYFTRIDKNQKLTLTSVPRKVGYTDSPLTETFKALFEGPVSTEKTADIITNIPGNSKIISVSIKDDVVYVNLSKEFEFNQYGRESTINQLKQVVFTATEFPKIRAVQFLIEGKVRTYLGGEGVIINKPLTRNDFS